MKTITADTINPASVATEQSKATKKAARAPRRADVAPAKGRAGKKATPPKNAPKPAKRAKAPEVAAGARDGSKTAKVLEMLKRPGGATAQELLRVTGWQAHSLRGFLSGTIGKKMGLAVISAKGEDGARNYSVEG